MTLADGEHVRTVREMGARSVSRESELERQFDIVVDACGDPSVLMRTLAHAAPEAMFTSVTIYLMDTVALPLRDLYFKGITFRTGRPNVRPPMEHVLDLCKAGAFKPHSVPAKVFAFEHAVEAWLDRGLRTVVTRI